MKVSRVDAMLINRMPLALLRCGGRWSDVSDHWIVQSNKKAARMVRRLLRRAKR